MDHAVLPLLARPRSFFSLCYESPGRPLGELRFFRRLKSLERRIPFFL